MLGQNRIVDHGLRLFQLLFQSCAVLNLLTRATYTIPFVGSGTTLIAAERQNRTCYAMELEPQYVDMSIARWEQYTSQTAVLVD